MNDDFILFPYRRTTREGEPIRYINLASVNDIVPLGKGFTSVHYDVFSFTRNDNVFTIPVVNAVVLINRNGDKIYMWDEDARLFQVFCGKNAARVYTAKLYGEDVSR
jgi:hypothetical protein